MVNVVDMVNTPLFTSKKVSTDLLNIPQVCQGANKQPKIVKKKRKNHASGGMLEKSVQLFLDYRVSYMSGGARFLPSTV